MRSAPRRKGTVHAEIVEKLARTRQVIEERGLDLVLVHHDGHQADASDFTRWNARADASCAEAARQRGASR